MEKKVTFEKNIEFPTMIGEISAISLEHDLHFINAESIKGDLLLTGRYKLTEASRLEEDFSYKIPVEITLTNQVNIDTGTIEISDFSYELKNESKLICNIELLIEAENLEIITEEIQQRECDGDIEEDPIIDDTNEVEKVEDIQIDSDPEEQDYSLFSSLNKDSETYGTFVVYIVRENESVNTIIEKYNTTLDEIEKYNDLTDLQKGSKLIIPLLNE